MISIKLNKIQYILIVLILYFIQLSSYAQEQGKLFARYYSQADYGRGAQNWDIAQDKNGILYFANQYGLKEYDGTNWRQYELLNQSTPRTLEISAKGHIVIGGVNELGYFFPDNSGNLKYHTLVDKIDSANRKFGDVWNIEIIGDSWYFLTDHYLFRFRDNRFTIWKSSGEYFYYSYKINDELYVQDFGKGLYKVMNNSLKLMPNQSFFANKKILTILPYQDKMLIETRYDGIFVYDPKKSGINSISEISPQAKRINAFFIKHTIYSGLRFQHNKYIIGSLSNGLMVFDEDFKILDIINKETCGLSSPVYYLYLSNNGELWMALDNGIQKVELYTPFRFWDLESGIKGTVNDILPFNNSIYVSTTQGVFFLDKYSEQYGINKFVVLPALDQHNMAMFRLDPKSLDKSSNLVDQKSKLIGKYPIRDKTLIAANIKGVYGISGKKVSKIFDNLELYTIYPSAKDSSKIYLGLRNGLARIRYSKGYWYDEGKFPIGEPCVWFIQQDKYGNLWYAGEFPGVYKIAANFIDTAKSSDFKYTRENLVIYDTLDGLPKNNSIYLYSINNNLKFESDSSVYVYDYSTNKFVKDNSKGNNYIDNTWAGGIFVDYEQNSWIDAVDKNKKNGRFYKDTLSYKRLSKYVINNVIRDDLKRLWIGTTDAIFCHEDKYGENLDYKFPALIRTITLDDDSVIYKGYNFFENENSNITFDSSNQVKYKPEISYKHNEISFTYSATFYKGEAKNEFSYYLKGYDKSWSNWSNETKKAYTNLPEGSYVFKVKARNFYGIESTVASFEFKILTPWYRSVVAYFAYAAIVVLVVLLIVKFRTFKLLIEKQKLENIVLARTQEILMQNEEIKVQAENLSEANEKIKAKNRELENQKDELVKKTEQLEISNATKNTFFRIIAHDLRNPISTFLNSTYFLLDNFDQNNKEKTKHFISELHKLSQTTFNLLENLLEWSMNQMGEMKFDPKTIDIRLIICENIELIEHRIDLKQIKLDNTIPDKIEVVADENMVSTIVRNLLSNAVKFTHEGGKIEISHRNVNGFCEISISDTGVGIDEKDIEKIFRIDKSFTTPGTKNEKGTGLGLILCKDFIEKNGGTLTIKSIPGKGSTFAFTLKLV